MQRRRRQNGRESKKISSAGAKCLQMHTHTHTHGRTKNTNRTIKTDLKAETRENICFKSKRLRWRDREEHHDDDSMGCQRPYLTANWECSLDQTSMKRLRCFRAFDISAASTWTMQLSSNNSSSSRTRSSFMWNTTENAFRVSCLHETGLVLNSNTHTHNIFLLHRDRPAPRRVWQYQLNCFTFS